MQSHIWIIFYDIFHCEKYEKDKAECIAEEVVPFSMLQIRFAIDVTQEMLAEVRQIKCQGSA